MFNKLFNLYEKNNKQKPLEDFTTELFLGVLQNNPKLFNTFCWEVLGLKSEIFSVDSQVRFTLPDDDPNCIVDIVIKGKNRGEGNSEICFIENKVNSKEGYRQLERYSRVLNEQFPDHNTKLVYCTKYEEKKDTSKYEQHNFQQFKWHHIAAHCKKYEDDNLVKLFIDFLNRQDMAMDMNITATDLLTMHNFSRVYRMIHEYLKRVEHEFVKLFGEKKNDSQYTKHFRNHLEEHNRICIYNENALEGKGFSEVLYAFGLDGRLAMNIYVHNEAEQYHTFEEAIKNYKESGLGTVHFDHGSSIYIHKNIGDFINNSNAESEIENWFLDAFQLLHQFRIDTSKTLKWNNLHEKEVER